MEDNVIKVSVRPNKQNSVKVSSNVVSTPITANSDTSQLWSQVSKNWAISENIVDNTDYSSKYYANKAKESASNAQGFESAIRDVYNGFLGETTEAIENVQGARDEAIANIETSRVEAVDSINSTKTTILSDIEFVADGEKQEIEELIDNGKDELKEAIGDVKVLITLEIGDIGFTQIAIDESKGLRRYLNGQVIIQDQYVEFTNKVKSSVALNPDLACTEAEWQTAVTMSANGVCYKFVIDDNAGTIRLPKYPTYLDLTNNTSAVSKTVSIKGNGKAMGLMGGADGTITGGLVYTSEGFGVRTGMYNQPLATKYSSGEFAINYTSGLTTDASKSGITGSVSIPAVQSEKIKGTYFIQVATGSETEENIINEIELNNPFSLLDYKYSEYELNNLSWLRSEGQYNSKAIYPAVYDLLLKIYNGTETKAGVSVKLHTDTSATEYDFRINTAEETFMLPTKVKLASGKAVVGNGMTLGLTNGTSNYAMYMSGNGGGALVPITSAYGGNIGSVSNSKTFANTDTQFGVTSDPTKSGIELSDSGLYIYFYVGETVQNANLINAGRIEETLAGKLDRSAVKAYITETYVSGASGYRIWSDKYCEQWGRFTNAATAETTITLLKAFSNTNYIITKTFEGGYSSLQVQSQYISIGAKTTTTFTTKTYNTDGLTTFTWKAEGYIN